MALEGLQSRFAAISLREKVMVLLAGALTVVVLPYALLYVPSERRLEAAKQELAMARADIGSLTASITALVPRHETVGGTPSAPVSDDLAGMLKAITREAGAAGTDLLSLTPEGSTSRNGYQEMKVKIDLRARFRALHDLLNSLESQYRLLMIREVRYETNDAVYPSGTAVLKGIVYLRNR